MDHDSTLLDYRAGRDAAADDARTVRRSFRTWVILGAIWLVGLGVWAVYLAALGYAVVMLLG